MAKAPGIDLSKFKHVSSDNKTTKLKHPDGHFLVIAHNNVKGATGIQLKALAEGYIADKAKNKPKELSDKVSNDAKNPQDRQGYDLGGIVNTLKSQGTEGQAEANEEKRRKEAADKVGSNPQADTSGVDVRTDEQKERAKAAAAQYGYAKGGEVDEKQLTSMQPEVLASRQKHGSIPSNHKLQTDSRQQYADGGMSQIVPDYLDPDAAAQQPADKVPPDLQQTREIYNRLASDVNPKGMTAPVRATQFSEDGSAPAIFNPKIAQQAQVEQSEEKADNAAGIAQQQQDIIAQNQQRTAMGLQPLPVPDVPNGPQIPGSEANPAPPQPDALNAAVPKDSIAQGMGDMAGMMQKGYQSQLQGIQQGAKAAGALGEEQAKLLNENIKAQQTAQVSYKQQYDALEQERQAHMADIKNGYIDPNQYWTGDKNGNGSHSKIASAIGMILAGFNPTNRPNAAVDMLKYQMDQNLAAQKENLGMKQNLLTANLRQFGNLRDATDMTKLMQSDIMQNELKTAAAKAQSPMAKAAALQAAGQLQMQFAPLQQQMAMRQSMMQMANGGGDPQSVEHMLGYMRVANPEMAKEMEARYVPGVGLASVPVPPAVREQLVMKQQFGSAVSNMRQWASEHSGSLSPTDIATGKTMAANVQNLYREAINGGVFKAGEQNFINGIIDNDPTKFFNNIRVLPKLDQAMKENESSLNILKKSNGLPVKQTTHAQSNPQQQTQAAMQWAKANPNDPRSAKILQRLGQ